MKRFAGKFSIHIDGRKLILFETRVGLIANDRSTIVNRSGQTVPLPPEAEIFFAIDQGDDTFILQASNGEAVSFLTPPPSGPTGDLILDQALASDPKSTLLVATTYPSQTDTIFRTTIARFSLSIFRAGLAENTLRLNYYLLNKHVRIDLGYINSQHDLDEYKFYLTNLSNSVPAGDPRTRWTVRQLADGVTDMTTGAKQVRHGDFTPAGRAVVDLSGENLSGVDFGNANFTDALLMGTNLQDSKHDGAVFRRSQLDRADFTRAQLQRVNFSTASLDQTIFTKVSGGGCDFSSCQLLSVVVEDAPLRLTSTAAEAMRFSYAKLKFALIGANWQYKRLDWAELSAIPASVPNLLAQHADLTGIDLTGLKAPQAKFDEAIMLASRFHEAALTNASFVGARLDGLAPNLAAANFTAARLQGSTFKDAQLSDVSFEGARMDEAVFDGATLQFTNFANAYMKAVNFSAVGQRKMTGVNFSRTFLVGCDFTGADLSTYDNHATKFDQAYLQGANFTSAKLGGAVMSGAGLSEDDGELRVRIEDRTITVRYKETKIDPAVSTTRETMCPVRGKGPCMETLYKDDFPASWPWPMGEPIPEA